MSAAKLLKKRGAKVRVTAPAAASAATSMATPAIASVAKTATKSPTAVRPAAKSTRRKKPKGVRGPAIWRVRGGRRYATQLSYADLLTAESALGRTLFGPVPAGHQREFFTPRKNVWLWYERWTDAAGAWHDMTIRYEVRPAGVYKLPTGGIYTRLEGAELANFATAVRSYGELVKRKLYS